MSDQEEHKVSESTAVEQTVDSSNEPKVNAPKLSEDQAEISLKICRDINQMPVEVQDRFKAMKVIYDQIEQINSEEDAARHAIELKYEKLYAQVYKKRAALLTGEPAAVDETLIASFDERSKILADPEFGEVDIVPCDVKEIQNTPYGIPNFWLKAMCNNKDIARNIFEKDRAILGYLTDIQLDLHEEGYGFDLTFHFAQNNYFKESQLKKSFFMKVEHCVDKAVGCTITWNAGSDPTKTMKKKGKKKVKVQVKCDSFFNFFETIIPEDSSKGDDDSDDCENDQDEQLENDLDLGTEIKDNLVPLGLEYYLNVIPEDEDNGDDDDDDDENDSDEDEKPAKSKKSDAKGKPAEGGAAGGEKQECK